MANQQDKLTCITCGGTFFTTGRAEQFIAGGYGSAEFRSISNAPKTVLSCIGCGTPVTPKPAYFSKSTVAGVAEEEFRKSVEAGQKHREKNSVKNISNIVATNNDLDELRELVQDIRKAVDAQGKSKAPKPKQLVGVPHVSSI